MIAPSVEDYSTVECSTDAAAGLNNIFLTLADSSLSQVITLLRD
jgi:hypothetical protein